MITSAAILHDGLVWTGRRHGFIIHYICQITGCKCVPGSSTQGFVTNTGEFLNRGESLLHALGCGQIKSPKQLIGSELTSEDLW